MKTTSIYGVFQFKKSFRMLLLLLWLCGMHVSAQTIVPSTDPSFVTVNSSLSAAPTHLSCDGLTYNSGSSSMKVFAWDGADQGWAYDDGTGVTVMSYSTTNTVAHPEIAIVSNQGGSCIFAIIVYEDGTGAYYEAYYWSSTLNTWTLFTTRVSLPSSASVLTVTVNVAGDEWGHFVIVYDDGTTTGTSIRQWVGYIDNSCNLQTGLSGTITRSNYEMWQPDADVTFDALNSSPDDGLVYLTFITKEGFTIMAAGIQFATLYAGGTHDILTNSTAIAEVANSYLTDHPSISANDGLSAYTNSYVPHAGVAYQEKDGGYEFIRMFGVTPRTYTSGSIVINPPSVLGVTNRYPTAVAQPIEVITVVTWDFIDNGSFPNFDLEGLAHGADYDLVTNTYDPTITDDMQVQTPAAISPANGSGNTTVTTASGLNNDDLLYFYYDDATSDLEYKTRKYVSTSLRKSENIISPGLTIFPNPVSTSISISSLDNIVTSILTDAVGRTINLFNGNRKELENTLNKNINSLATGMYFLKSTCEDGHIVVAKFLKQ